MSIRDHVERRYRSDVAPERALPALPRRLEAGDEAGKRVGGDAARQHHLDELEVPARRHRAVERRGELVARAHPHAVAAERAGELAEAPVVEVVEAALG